MAGVTALALSGISANAVHAGSVPVFTLNDLYGVWSGTYTPSPTPMPTIITPSGISDFNTTPAFFDPQSWSATFSSSSQFAFGFNFGNPAAPPGTTGFLPTNLTAASVNGNTLTWELTALDPLSNGKSFDSDTMQFTATVQLNNSGQFQMNGQWVMTPLADSLPSNSTGNVVLANADFSLMQTNSPSSPSAVPLPSAAWMSLTMLGGLAVIGAFRARLRGIEHRVPGR
jgi:hypothetical protein